LRGWEVDGTSSRSCPTEEISFSDDEAAGSATTVLQFALLNRI